jgi:hypothetical protein
MKKMILFLLLVLTQAAFGQWQAISYIEGQNIISICVDDCDVYVGTSNGSIYRSTNFGGTWTIKLPSTADKTINSIVKSDKYIIAGTSTGILISSDNGNHWIENNNGLVEKDIRALSINGNKIYAGIYKGGVFVSTNNGYSWIAKNDGQSNLDIVALATKGNFIIAGTPKGILLSEDLGESWSKFNNGLSELDIKAVAIDNENFIAGTSWGIYYCSINNSKWCLSKLITNIKFLASNNGFTFLSVLDNIIYLSRDGGESWLPRNNGIEKFYVSAISFDGDFVYAGLKVGSFCKTDLFSIDTKPQISNIYNIAIDANTNKTIEFSINAYEPDKLEIIKVCDNTKLLPLDSIKIFNSYPNKAVFIAPAKGKSGVANVTLKVTDGIDTAQESFVVNVLKTSKAVDNYFTKGLNITIQPNPATENITISLINASQPIVTSGLLSIYNSLGIEMKRFSVNELAGQTSLNFSTDGLVSGVYFCKYSSGTDNITKSFIVIK